ncbi:Ccr4-not transcription complex subunit 6-like protein [Plakobranchus ocellatus]|uniref:Ccr4-not transcription complex subunit 6-like protein n=1 Tax=Plakobranchus ocellatus TaxID=259542 RepID=A0AAV4ACP7_9GAST|nr:Ccr4-not transcription complex subunit 6-like protein [Plakobranchus ocellatus]
MGKLQDSERSPIGVKREVVSASAHLEVISQESFVWRREGMSSSSNSSSSSSSNNNNNSSSSCGQNGSTNAAACANCHKERTRTSHSNGNNCGSNSGSNNHHYHHKASGRRGKTNRRKQQHHNQNQSQASNRQNANVAAGKSNSPIVIHLKESLREGPSLQAQGRQSSLEDHDSDVSRSTDEEQSSTSSGSSSERCGGRRKGPRGSNGAHHSTSSSSSSLYRSAVSSSIRGRSSDVTWSDIYTDVASIPEFVPKSYYHVPHNSQYYLHHYYPHYSQPWPVQPAMYHPSQLFSPLAIPGFLYHEKIPYHSFRATTQKAKEKSRKNLTALISVIEKAHRKEPAQDIEPNLSHNSEPDAKLSGSILNNASSAASPSRPPYDDELKRRNMAECENVELICNDLSSKITPSVTGVEDPRDSDKTAMSESSSSTTDESDQSDKASVASSSDTLSDDLGTEFLPALESGQMTPGELQQLAEYTTGVPLMRFDGPVHHHPPHICHQCSAWYTYDQNYQRNDPHNVELYCRRAPYRAHMRVQPRHKFHAPTPRTSISSDSDVSSDVDDSSSTASSESSIPSSRNEKAEAFAQETGKVCGSSEEVSQDIKSDQSRADEGKDPGETIPGKHQPLAKLQSTNHSSSTSTKSVSTSVKASKSHSTNALEKSHAVKRATASWKTATHAARSPRQLWDIDVWSSSRRRAARYFSPYHHYDHLHHSEQFRAGPPFPDRVYLDLTGLDVTIDVTYHNHHHQQQDQYGYTAAQPPTETPGADSRHHSSRCPSHEKPQGEAVASTAWPYPVHSLFQALYSPTVTAPVQGIQLPLRFNNTVFYPLKGDSTPPMQLKKSGGVGRTVASESALKSAGTLLSRVRAPPPVPWPDRGPKSLRSSYCGLAVYETPDLGHNQYRDLKLAGGTDQQHGLENYGRAKRENPLPCL